MNIHELDEWFDGKYYHINITILTDDERKTLNNIMCDLYEQIGEKYWRTENGIVSFSEAEFLYDFDARLQFARFLKNLEERLEKAKIEEEYENQIVQIEKEAYYEEK